MKNLEEDLSQEVADQAEISPQGLLPCLLESRQESGGDNQKDLVHLIGLVQNLFLSFGVQTIQNL